MKVKQWRRAKRKRESRSRQFREIRGTMLERVDLIFNPVSGTGDPQVELNLIKELLSSGFSKVEVHKTTLDEDGYKLTIKAITDGARIVVASGGDGTVACVAAAISESQAGVILGVIPRGTANAFCAALGIPSNIEGACEQVIRGNTRTVDVPYVNGKAMMLLMGVGLEAEAVRRADRGLKRAIGVLAYLFAGIRSIAEQDLFKTTITMKDVDDNLAFGGEFLGEKIILKNLNVKGVTVANAAPATSVLAQGIGAVRPDDGLLEVVCLSSQGMGDTVTAVTSMFSAGLFRKRIQRADIFGLRAKQVQVSCDPPQRVVVDGEEIGKTPIEVVLNPKSQIQVLAPKAKVVVRKQRRFGRFLLRVIRNIRGAVLLGIVIVLLSKNKVKRSKAQP